VPKDFPVDPLYLLQITDPHLKAEADGELLGVNTRDSFDAVLDHVRRRHHSPDAVLATGDLSQDGTEASYRYFQSRMAVFDCPVFWFSGNHDHRPVMNSLIQGTPADQRSFRRGGWQLLFLDSSVPGQVHGELREEELGFLDRALSEHPDEHALVCLHHHPIDISASWMNGIGLHNREAFFAVLERHPQVRGLLWGHIHQELDEERQGIRMLASPSTCVQFRPGSDSFSVDEVAPGYRWLRLYPDGRIETGVERIERTDFGVDLDSGGY